MQSPQLEIMDDPPPRIIEGEITLDKIYSLHKESFKSIRSTLHAVNNELHGINKLQEEQEKKISKIDGRLSVTESKIKQIATINIDDVAKNAAIAALSSIGLDDKEAIFDIRKMRDFIHGLEATKASFWKETMKAILYSTPSVLTLIILSASGAITR